MKIKAIVTHEQFTTFGGKSSVGTIEFDTLQELVDHKKRLVAGCDYDDHYTVKVQGQDEEQILYYVSIQVNATVIPFYDHDPERILNHINIMKDTYPNAEVGLIRKYVLKSYNDLNGTEYKI